MGAGTVGLSAAILAAKRSASVLLVGAAEKLAGMSHLANGKITAAGSRLPEAVGIADLSDTHFHDLIALGRGLADPHVVRLTVDQASGTV